MILAAHKWPSKQLTSAKCQELIADAPTLQENVERLIDIRIHLMSLMLAFEQTFAIPTLWGHTIIEHPCPSVLQRLESMPMKDVVFIVFFGNSLMYDVLFPMSYKRKLVEAVVIPLIQGIMGFSGIWIGHNNAKMILNHQLCQYKI